MAEPVDADPRDAAYERAIRTPPPLRPFVGLAAAVLAVGVAYRSELALTYGAAVVAVNSAMWLLRRRAVAVVRAVGVDPMYGMVGPWLVPPVLRVLGALFVLLGALTVVADLTIDGPQWDGLLAGAAMIVLGGSLRLRLRIMTEPTRPEAEVRAHLAAATLPRAAATPLRLELVHVLVRGDAADRTEAIQLARAVATGLPPSSPLAPFVLGRTLRIHGDLGPAKIAFEDAWRKAPPLVRLALAKELEATWRAAGDDGMADAYRRHAHRLARRYGLRDRSTTLPSAAGTIPPPDDLTQLLASAVDREVAGRMA